MGQATSAAKAWAATRAAWQVGIGVCAGILSIAGVVTLIARNVPEHAPSPYELFHAGDDIDFLRDQLGAPKTRTQYDSYLRTEWVDGDVMVIALTMNGRDPAGEVRSPSEVVALGFTALRSRAMRVPLATFDDSNRVIPFEVILGETRFADLPDAPRRIAGWTGMASTEFAYGEMHYYASSIAPHDFVQVAVEVDQRGHLRGITGEAVNAAIQPLGRLGLNRVAHGGSSDSQNQLFETILDGSGNKSFRAAASINTLWVLERHFDAEGAATALGL